MVRLPGTGTRVVTFTQVFDGVEAVQGGRLNIAVAEDGKVLSYGGNPTRGSGLAGSFALSPAQALGAVAAKLAGDRINEKLEEKLGDKVSPELKDALKGLFKR